MQLFRHWYVYYDSEHVFVSSCSKALLPLVMHRLNRGECQDGCELKEAVLVCLKYYSNICLERLKETTITTVGIVSLWTEIHTWYLRI
jgi:hypothetical protein